MTSLVLSLFPGIGLLDRAFEQEGFCVVRGPDVLWGGDIRTFHPSAKFDGVIGGPPCQAFSALANLVRANGFKPKFGNLIPEFERCVAEAAPAWFLMENVPQAPVAWVDGYAVHEFKMCNSWLDGGDGFGLEQERKRRFCFGVRGGPAVDLRKWIRPAALLLPANAIYPAVTGGGEPPNAQKRIDRARTSAVVSDAREVPVKLGGSGKAKARVGSVTTTRIDNSAEAKLRVKAVTKDEPPSQRSGRIGAVTGGGQENIHQDGVLKKGPRRSIAEMCRLQGLPEDFLEDAPFTVQGKRKAIANGVPLPMGLALSGAIQRAREAGLC